MDAEQLESLPLFQGLSSKELARVAPLLDEVDAPAGRELARQDDLGHEFFVLLDGACEVRSDGNHIADLGPGDFFGEIALIDAERRTASVISTSPVRLAVMSRSAFRGMSSKYPEIGQRLRETIDQRNASRGLQNP